MHSPAMDGRVIDSDAAVSHHLFEISQTKVIALHSRPSLAM
jgi:hypothetical protein